MYFSAVLFLVIGVGSLVVAVVPGADEWVAETFLGLAAATWESLEGRMGLGSKHGIPREEFLNSLSKQLAVDVKTVKLSGIK